MPAPKRRKIVPVHAQAKRARAVISNKEALVAPRSAIVSALKGKPRSAADRRVVWLRGFGGANSSFASLREALERGGAIRAMPIIDPNPPVSLRPRQQGLTALRERYGSSGGETFPFDIEASAFARQQHFVHDSISLDFAGLEERLLSVLFTTREVPPPPEPIASMAAVPANPKKCAHFFVEGKGGPYDRQICTHCHTRRPRREKFKRGR